MQLALNPSQPFPSPVLAPGPLSAKQLAEISDARRRSKKIRRAAATAALSGWSIASFAAITLAFLALSFSWSAAILGAGMAIVAFNELRGRRLLLALSLRAPRLLAINQLAFGALLVFYSLWSVLTARSAPPPAELSNLDPEMADMLTGMTASISLIAYGSLAVISALATGLTALYYQTRERHLRRFLAETPTWVADILRAA